MMICIKCGNYFTEDEFFENDERCPFCDNRNVDEAVSCRLCGEWIPRSEHRGSYREEICEDCLHMADSDPDFLLAATDGCMEEIEIPAIYPAVLTDDEIRQALHQAVMAKKAADACRPERLREYAPRDFVEYYHNEVAHAIITESRKEQS